jgi:hypothetical protein
MKNVLFHEENVLTLHKKVFSSTYEAKPKLYNEKVLFVSTKPKLYNEKVHPNKKCLRKIFPLKQKFEKYI